MKSPTPALMIFGGTSDERLVAVASAQNIARNHAFEEIWFMDMKGALYRVPQAELLAHANPFKAPFMPSSKPFVAAFADAVGSLKGKTVYLAFHGAEGEDGTLQALLEKNDIAFVGSGSESSRMCFDKTRAKNVVAKIGIPLAPQLVFKTRDAGSEDRLRGFLATHKKLAIKPVANGSSVGLHIVAGAADLAKAVGEMTKRESESFMAEKFVTGRELTVGVFDGSSGTRALPPSEVVLNAGSSFDYDGKYLGRGSREITPALITESEARAAQDIALKAHGALGCFGYSRTDMILSPEGLVYLETNTLPGLTSASFVPQQLQVAGITMSEFIARQLCVAEERLQGAKVSRQRIGC